MEDYGPEFGRRWISQKVSNISKNSGTSSGSGSKGTYGTSSSGSSRPSGGSASGVNVYDDYQQDIRDQMNANSQAWHNAATKEEKDRLHAENERLSGLLGGDVSYDGPTGRWSGSADAPGGPLLTPEQRGIRRQIRAIIWKKWRPLIWSSRKRR